TLPRGALEVCLLGREVKAAGAPVAEPGAIDGEHWAARDLRRSAAQRSELRPDAHLRVASLPELTKRRRLGESRLPPQIRSAPTGSWPCSLSVLATYQI